GDEVRAGEGHVLLALLGDGVGADVVIDLAALDRRLPVGRGDLLVFNVRRVDAELRGNHLSHLDVEPAPLAGRILVAQVGLVELDADDNLLGRLDFVVRRAAGQRDRRRRGERAARTRAGVTGRGPGLAGVAGRRWRALLAAGGKTKRERGNGGHDREPSQIHSMLPRDTSLVHSPVWRAITWHAVSIG